MTTNPERYWTLKELLSGVELPPQGINTVTGTPWVMISDGVYREFKTRRKLQKMLDCTYAKRPEVFTNRGGGITIRFN